MRLPSLATDIDHGAGTCVRCWCCCWRLCVCWWWLRRRPCVCFWWHCWLDLVANVGGVGRARLLQLSLLQSISKRTKCLLLPVGTTNSSSLALCFVVLRCVSLGSAASQSVPHVCLLGWLLIVPAASPAVLQLSGCGHISALLCRGSCKAQSDPGVLLGYLLFGCQLLQEHCC